jgi:hypothetical protein
MNSPGIIISGASLTTSVVTLIYLNKRLNSLVEELNTHKESLSTTILEVSKNKSQDENISKLTMIMKSLHSQIEKQNKQILNIREVIIEFNKTFEEIIPQIDSVSNLNDRLLMAVGELQDLAKKNGTIIKNTIPSTREKSDLRNSYIRPTGHTGPNPHPHDYDPPRSVKFSEDNQNRIRIDRQPQVNRYRGNAISDDYIQSPRKQDSVMDLNPSSMGLNFSLENETSTSSSRDSSEESMVNNILARMDLGN